VVGQVEIVGQASQSLQIGDIVTAIVWPNGYRYDTHDAGSWNDALSMVRSGNVVTLRVYRMTQAGLQAVKAMRDAPAGEVQKFDVVLAAPPMLPQAVLAKLIAGGLSR
jgi:hypothetical protein